MPLREQPTFIWASRGASGGCEVVLQVPREASQCSGYRQHEMPLREQRPFLWSPRGASGGC